MSKPPSETAKLLAVTLTILESVGKAGSYGLPSGPLYSALTGLISYAVYMGLIEGLKGRGYLTQRGHVLYRTEKPLSAMLDTLAMTPVQIEQAHHIGLLTDAERTSLLTSRAG